MTTFAKTTMIAAAAVLTIGTATLSTSNSAQASDLGAGVAGFAIGTVLGAGLAAPRARYYEPETVVVYERPVRHGRVTPAGVSVRHANWCASRYRSYDWNSNTFVTYGGQVRTCR